MSIEIKCDKCQEELNEPGGLVFSPPSPCGGHDECIKHHLCKKCYNLFFEWLVWDEKK